MTNAINIEKIKREYATEDANILTENGCSAITGTNKGVLNNSFENGVYSIYYGEMGKYLFQSPDVECVIQFFMDSYIVEVA